MIRAPGVSNAEPYIGLWVIQALPRMAQWIIVAHRNDKTMAANTNISVISLPISGIHENSAIIGLKRQ